MKPEIIHMLLSITANYLLQNPINKDMTEEKYKSNRPFYEMHLEAIRELLEQLPEEERKQVPKSVAIDEAYLRSFFHLESGD